MNKNILYMYIYCLHGVRFQLIKPWNIVDISVHFYYNRFYYDIKAWFMRYWGGCPPIMFSFLCKGLLELLYGNIWSIHDLGFFTRCPVRLLKSVPSSLHNKIVATVVLEMPSTVYIMFFPGFDLCPVII